MTKKISVSELDDFDMARQLKNEEDIAAYVTMVIEEGDAAELVHVLVPYSQKAVKKNKKLSGIHSGCSGLAHSGIGCRESPRR